MSGGIQGLECHTCFNFQHSAPFSPDGLCKRHQQPIAEAYCSVCGDWFRDDVGAPHVWEALSKLKPHTLYSIEPDGEFLEVADLS